MNGDRCLATYRFPLLHGVDTGKLAMARRTMSPEEMQEAAEVLMRALEHVAEHDPRMTLGTLMALLTVVKLNGPTTDEDQRLTIKELWEAAAQHREVYGTFQAALTKLSTRVISTSSASSPGMSLVKIYAPPQNYRNKIAELTPEGRRLAADIARELQKLPKRE